LQIMWRMRYSAIIMQATQIILISFLTALTMTDVYCMGFAIKPQSSQHAYARPVLVVEVSNGFVKYTIPITLVIHTDVD